MTRVLILGGGFGGVRAALDLSQKLIGNKDVEICLLDRSDSQLFHPALYEVASVYGMDHEHPFHLKLKGTISIPYSEIFEGKKIKLIQAEVRHIDIPLRHVITNNGATIEFDYLVLALGSTTTTFGIPGAQEYAYKFKMIEDALMLNDKLEQLYIEASQKKRTLPINILICGAGFNGVELAAELAKCTVHIAHRHSVFDKNCTAVTVIEAGQMILPMISGQERATIEKRLKRLGIQIILNSAVEEVGPDFIKLKGGNILKGDVIVWSGGVKAVELFANVAGLEVDERSRIMVNDFLQVKNQQNVFAIGDNNIFIDQKNQKPVPQMALPAIEQGRLVAENITRQIKSSKKEPHLKKYKANYGSWVAPVGGKYAVAHVGERSVSGFMGYVLRELIDLRYFLSVLPFFKALKFFFEEVRVFSKND